MFYDPYKARRFFESPFKEPIKTLRVIWRYLEAHLPRAVPHHQVPSVFLNISPLALKECLINILFFNCYLFW